MNESLHPVIDSPPNHLLRIDSCYLFISSDEQGEGLCAAPMPNFPGLMPLIAADPAWLRQLMALAQELATLTGKTIRLIKLTQREQLAVIEPAR